MNILGFNCYGHDSAAALLVDGEVVFAVEEERLTRKKHVGAFPVESIRAALKYANLKLSDIDHVGFFWKPRLSYPHIPLFFLRHLHRMPALLFESKDWSMEENLGMIHYWGQMRRLPAELRAIAPGEKARFKFHYLEHHLCHAASAFYPSGFEEAAIMTVDGGGEWTTALLAHGKGRQIQKLSEISIPHSLGAFYQSIARYLGFQLITGPGKLMGLASYGNRQSAVYEKMKKMIRFLPEGRFALDLSYFSYHYTRRSCGMSKKFIKMFGAPKVQGRYSDAGDWTETELDIAAATQRLTEDIFIHIARHLHKATGQKALAISGGVGLNSVANGRILQETDFRDIFIQPAAGDSGTSLGATLYLYHTVLGNERKYTMKDAFLGPGYSQENYRREIERSGFAYVETPRYAAIAAKLLKKGKILGWFEGRLEFGPRALGNRSILANPSIPEMKDTLNARVKFRESFRPFAPIILEDCVGDYFDNNYPSPYMLLVYNVREEKKKEIVSSAHVDGTGRVQTVNRRENPQMWELLTEYRKLTGVPVLINTSFNIKGEPIVCTPFDALDSFRRADIDYLVIGNFIVGKKPEDLKTDDFC